MHAKPTLTFAALTGIYSISFLNEEIYLFQHHRYLFKKKTLNKLNW